MFPLGSTLPGTTCAIAASMFAAEAVLLSVSRFTNSERLATVAASDLSHLLSGVRPASIRDGWTMGSLTLATSLRARTWLLLRINCVPLRATSDPSVPPQQIMVFPLVLASLLLPPDAASAIAPVWLFWFSGRTVTAAEPEAVLSACDTAVTVSVGAV